MKSPIYGRKCPQKTSRGVGEVVRQVGLNDPPRVACRMRASGFAAGGRHVGEKQRMFRIARQQGVDQGFCRSGFADGNGMQPYQRARTAPADKAVALANVLPIFGLSTSAPQQAYPDQRLRGIERTV